MTSAAVDKLFDTIGPRFGDRQGGYRASSSWDGARAMAPTRSSSNSLAAKRSKEEKRQKRAEARRKRAAEAKKAMEEAEQPQGGEVSGATEEDKK